MSFVLKHLSFAFPGTGRFFDTGYCEGVGSTRNYPVLPGKGDKEYMGLVERDLLPVLGAFSPEVVIVSLAFVILKRLIYLYFIVMTGSGAYKKILTR